MEPRTNSENTLDAVLIHQMITPPRHTAGVWCPIMLHNVTPTSASRVTLSPNTLHCVWRGQPFHLCIVYLLCYAGSTFPSIHCVSAMQGQPEGILPLGRWRWLLQGQVLDQHGAQPRGGGPARRAGGHLRGQERRAEWVSPNVCINCVTFYVTFLHKSSLRWLYWLWYLQSQYVFLWEILILICKLKTLLGATQSPCYKVNIKIRREIKLTIESLVTDIQPNVNLNIDFPI